MRTAAEQRPRPATLPSKRSPEAEKLQTRLCRSVGEAIADYRMIEAGDRIMVCLSGGKDSYGLLDVLLALRRRAPIRFDLVAVNLDQKQPGFPDRVLPDYLTGLGVPFHIETRDTYAIVKRMIPDGKTTCSLCSRLRRGILYRVAAELGATKIALGHHRDDIVETLFLNMIYGGKLKGMAPIFRAKERGHIVIRPLAYVREAELARYAELMAFPIIPCDLCGSQDNLKRKAIKTLLQDWAGRFPGSIENIFAAMADVVPSRLMDRRLHDFTAHRAGDRDEEDDDLPA